MTNVRLLAAVGIVAVAVGVPSAQALRQVSPPAVENPFVGTWTVNVPKSKLPSDFFQFQRVTLQFAVVFDTVTIGSDIVAASGEELISTELYHMDGKEHPSTLGPEDTGSLGPGAVLRARWANSRVIEIDEKANGQDVGVSSYAVSADGKTLTNTFSTLPDLELVFDHK